MHDQPHADERLWSRLWESGGVGQASQIGMPSGVADFCSQWFAVAVSGTTCDRKGSSHPPLHWWDAVRLGAWASTLNGCRSPLGCPTSADLEARPHSPPTSPVLHPRTNHHGRSSRSASPRPRAKKLFDGSRKPVKVWASPNMTVAAGGQMHAGMCLYLPCTRQMTVMRVQNCVRLYYYWSWDCPFSSRQVPRSVFPRSTFHPTCTKREAVVLADGFIRFHSYLPRLPGLSHLCLSLVLLAHRLSAGHQRSTWPAYPVVAAALPCPLLSLAPSI
ncbi:hypothetical protein B0T26DRAFT_527794 [Lasiosphaeria miniovina]|uniref:Uncharacterized protein n=1 Tax=Lasiosphaeria miniovina TaxID=1954250 RepID=A0AA39ZQ85_9PEZI|nr:uncharacterized protein B0T26DRAFT_527794 [Lasiosphaeria miniovina]KAK0701699.1 hypothetical protein B0T26DRAFT_527794 [Lasiosphaeria miniovina]